MKNGSNARKENNVQNQNLFNVPKVLWYYYNIKNNDKFKLYG